MVYLSNWLSLAEALKRLMTDTGCSQNQAQLDICQAIADEVLTVRAKLARHDLRPQTSKEVIRRQPRLCGRHVKAIETEGFRDAQLHQLATMLHDTSALHPSRAQDTT